MERFPLYLMLLLFPCNLAENCPNETWYDTGNPDLGCIFFGGKAKTWVEAHEECEGYVGHMAEATTMEQVIIIVETVKPPNKYPASISMVFEILIMKIAGR